MVVLRLPMRRIAMTYLKGARIRIGQMKCPTAEEGYQGIFVFDYANQDVGALAIKKSVQHEFLTRGGVTP